MSSLQVLCPCFVTPMTGTASKCRPSACASIAASQPYSFPYGPGQADTDEHLQARPEVQQHLFYAAQAPVQRGTAIPLALDSLPILGAPIGTSAYCTAQISKTITSIQRDLDLLSTFDHRHQRRKLALYCCNSRIARRQAKAPDPRSRLGNAAEVGPARAGAGTIP